MITRFSFSFLHPTKETTVRKTASKRRTQAFSCVFTSSVCFCPCCCCFAHRIPCISHDKLFPTRRDHRRCRQKDKTLRPTRNTCGGACICSRNDKLRGSQFRLRTRIQDTKTTPLHAKRRALPCTNTTTLRAEHPRAATQKLIIPDSHIGSRTSC